MNIRKHTSGFTIIELLVVVVIIGILSTLVVTTYSGVQAKNRNGSRQVAIDTLQSQLETYYAQYSRYPTYANLNDAAWRQANLKDLSAKSLEDPHWNTKNAACTTDNKVIIASQPASDCYSYQPIGPDGTSCDNDKVICAQYTLTAMLEGGGKYVKGSLN
jgi:prepilin-type N-terminal cleavage/methylation domain-containing protein